MMALGGPALLQRKPTCLREEPLLVGVIAQIMCS